MQGKKKRSQKTDDMRGGSVRRRGGLERKDGEIESKRARNRFENCLYI